MSLPRTINYANVAYLLSGIFGRLQGAPRCPDCGSETHSMVDKKFFHRLMACANCELRYRYPLETPAQMARFYQSDYQTNDMATELPDAKVVQRLLQDGVAHSAYDRSWNMRVLKQLGLRPGAKVLDFGTSWGYFTLQLKQSGFDASGFEISVPRANFAKNLQIDVHSDESEIARSAAEHGFDIVSSTHVIEHVPRPLEKLTEQLSWVKVGGTVVASTPNGSAAAQAKSGKSFSLGWGKVHPVLLSAESVARRFPNIPLLITSDDSAENLALWDGTSRKIDICDGPGLWIALRRVD
jgi:2-polyprenyl-3-methyl-5-hydroxy-6-metoxy-1,4-benzoquinol methylase